MDKDDVKIRPQVPEKRAPKLDVYEDTAGGWRWRLKAGNGEIVATGESYTRRQDAVRGFRDAMHAVLDMLHEVVDS